MGLVRFCLEHCATRERGFRPKELVYRVASVPIVRIRILADAESRPGLRALVEAACPAGQWRYPDYCYLEVRETGPVSPVSVPLASTLGGALSRLRAAVRRGARGLIEESLAEEESTDELLSELAEEAINPAAAGEATE